MDTLISLRDGLQEYSCTCIAKAYEHMGSYGPEWQHLKHLHAVLIAWNLLDSEITRLTAEE
jgi:hypothetical protein